MTQAFVSPVTPIEKGVATKKTSRNIPESLVRETVEGIPFYYPGFRGVLNKTKKLEEIMSDSGLQAYLKDLIGDLIKAQIDRKFFIVIAGEVGSHLDNRNNFGLDIAIYDRQVLTNDKITTKFVDVPPKIVLEIDVNVQMGPDSTGNLFEQYMVPKIQQLFAFGTERVFWVFTKTRTILMATEAGQWSFPKWDSDLEIMPGVTVNIARLIEEEGLILV